MVSFLPQSFTTKFQEFFHSPVYLTLRNGKEVDIANLRPEDIDIDDIKCSLFHIARFNGHSSCHYSVGEHSVNCFRAAIGDNRFFEVVQKDVKLFKYEKNFLKAVFTHDFSEAYCGDIITPIKKYLGKKFAKLEHKIHLAISRRFNIDFKKYKSAVKDIDLHVLDIELSLYKRKRLYLENQDVKNLWDEADMIGKDFSKKYFDIICNKLDIK